MIVMEGRSFLIAAMLEAGCLDFARDVNAATELVLDTWLGGVRRHAKSDEDVARFCDIFFGGFGLDSSTCLPHVLACLEGS